MAKDLTIKISGDAKGLKGALSDSEGYLSGFAGKAGKWAGGAALAIGGIGLAGVAMIPGILDTGASIEALGMKAATVFEDSLGSVQSWAGENAAALGMTTSELTGMAAGMADLLKPMGFTAEAAADMSTQTLDLAGALSAWSGGQKSAAEVSEILSAAYLGETDSLKGLGISLSAAEIDAALAAKGQDKLTGAALEQAKALAIQELILAKSTDAQKAWSDGSMDSIKSQNEAKASLAQLKETLITAVYPALTGLVPLVTAGAQWLGEKLPVAIAFVKDAFNTYLLPAIQAAGDLFGSLVTWVQTHWASISLTIETGLGYIQGLITTVTTIISAAWSMFGDELIAYAQGAWDFISGIVSAGLTIIQGVIDTVMGLIRGDWGLVWDGIQGIVSGVLDAIGTIIEMALDSWKIVLSAAWDVIKLAAGLAWDALKAIVSGAIDGAWALIKGTLDLITAGLSAAWEGAKTAASDAFTALKDTATGAIDDVWSAISGLPDLIIGLASDFLSAGATIGSNILDGIKDGLNSAIDFAADIAKGVKNAVIDSINWVVDKLNSAIPDSLGWGPAKIDIDDNPIPHVPKFHSGGMVGGGRPGDEVLAVLQVGEYVQSRDEVAAGRRGRGISIGTINVSDGRSIHSELQLIDALYGYAA